MKKRRTYREETVDLHRQIGMFDVLYVDSFAGGGGASTGIELATGHPVDIAINHDESAIMMHQRNHPFTKHYREDIWKVDPIKATGGAEGEAGMVFSGLQTFFKGKRRGTGG